MTLSGEHASGAPSGGPRWPDAESAHPFYEAALREARNGLSEGGVPIGAVLVSQGRLAAAGHNRRVQSGDPTAHAEIECLRHGGRGVDYRDSTLISTLAPCAMCSGAILQFGIPRVLVGEAVTFGGELELLRARGVVVEVLDDARAQELMSGFVGSNPRLWNEDIGVPDI